MDLELEKKQRNRLRQQVEESSDMPNISDYIEQKRTMYNLESQLRNWKKKLEIMEMAAKQSRNLLMKTRQGK